ncbi:MAG: hypothetical protein IKF38_00295 [Clostridia bacterium]|nr:hypothetical protein [Clostridia bacterium]
MREKFAKVFLCTTTSELNDEIHYYCKNYHYHELAELRSAPVLAFDSDGIVTSVGCTCVFEKLDDSEDSELEKRFK